MDARFVISRQSSCPAAGWGFVRSSIIAQTFAGRRFASRRRCPSLPRGWVIATWMGGRAASTSNLDGPRECECACGVMVVIELFDDDVTAR